MTPNMERSLARGCDTPPGPDHRSEDVRRDVRAPDVAECVADLADGGAGAQGVFHGVEDVVVAFGGFLQGRQGRGDGRLVAFGAQRGQAFGQPRLDGRVDAQRLKRPTTTRCPASVSWAIR